jgi:hypothetical protein
MPLLKAAHVTPSALSLCHVLIFPSVLPLVTNYVRHPSRDRGKPRDLSLSYVAHDRGNTRDQA